MDLGAQLKRLLKSRHAIILTVVLVGQLLVTLGYSREENVPNVPSLEEMPRALNGWRFLQENKVEPEVMEVLRADDALTRYYTNEKTYASLFIGYFKTQRAGQSPHSPKNCLPGAGWSPSESGFVDIALPELNRTITVNKYVVTKGDNRSLVLYWYQSLDRVVASEYMAKIYLVTDAIRYNRTDTALVRVVLPVGPDGVDAALNTGKDFIRKSFPQVQAYFPPAT